MMTTKPTAYHPLPKTSDLQPHQGLTIENHNRKKRGCCSCFFCFSIPIFIIAIITTFVYLTAPGRTNILILGIDSRDQSSMGRSDTIIMATYIPSQPYMGMFSVPRDLWVEIPGHGYNRINTANFFAEIENPGTGPIFAIETIKNNFGVDMDYYIRLDFIGFLDLIDAMGGIEIHLPIPMSGYDKGLHHLNGRQALAFVRDRDNSDDFSRMKRGQILIKALIDRLVYPASWLKLPQTMAIVTQNLETNLPLWRWPQLAITILRVGSNNIDARTIDREMVNPLITEGGAYVLAPLWDVINPVLLEMFGQ
jgi:LCP family protein required for cell wall assembly